MFVSSFLNVFWQTDRFVCDVTILFEENATGLKTDTINIDL